MPVTITLCDEGGDSTTRKGELTSNAIHAALRDHFSCDQYTELFVLAEAVTFCSDDDMPPRVAEFIEAATIYLNTPDA